jgi:NADH:ubiquinone oxidoreductase subunit 6 (subunit J)
MTQVIFIILGVLTLGCALMVVTRRNLFHSAVFLAFSFVGVAGIYLLLQAEFLAGIQVLVYVGAIVTLIIFAIMLTRDIGDPELRSSNAQWRISVLVALAVFVVLVIVVTRVAWPAAPVFQSEGEAIVELGKQMVSPDHYVLPFEVVSVLLLVALVGSIIIAREREQ